MIKGLLASLFMLTAYTVVLKYFVQKPTKESARFNAAAIGPAESNKLELKSKGLGVDVDDLVRYRQEMLEKVNLINQMVQSPAQMDRIKEIIKGPAKNWSQLKKHLNGEGQVDELKQFLLKYSPKNLDFLQPKKVLTEKDSQHFEVVEPMTLKEYKKKFNLKW